MKEVIKAEQMFLFVQNLAKNGHTVLENRT
jgi:hypothetical protein